MGQWRKVPLRSVATIARDAVDPAFIDANTLYVGLENIERGGAIHGVSTAAEAGITSLKYRFTSKQVLFGKLRPYLAKVARPPFDGVCSTDILPITPGNQLDRDYLAHFLLLPDTIALASARATGANLPRLSAKELAALEIPLPSLAEQRRIAALLDQADALRAKREQTLAHLDELGRALFLDMFGDPELGWKEVTVADVAAPEKGSIRTGPFGSQLLHSEFVTSGVAVLGIDNAVNNEFSWARPRYITEEKYRQLSRYQVFPGDVIITIMGTCGRCAIVPDDIPLAISTKHLCCITLDQNRCLPEFLHAYFLQHPIARRYLAQTAKGAIMSGLNMEIIKALPITLPPLDLQKRFVRRLEALRESRRLHSEQQTAFDELFDSLRSRAFRGEL